MGSWVGPAVVAALIAAFVSAAGWFVTTRQALALERARRRERTRDFQIALRAEIRSELADLTAFDLDAELEQVRGRYRDDPAYRVRVPELPRHLIIEAIIPEIHVLSEGVIQPVVLYLRQRQVVGSLISDIRSTEFALLDREDQLEIYEEYVELRGQLAVFAAAAELALRLPSSR